MRLPTLDDYAWALSALTPVERIELDTIVMDIVQAEIDGTDPDSLAILAELFAAHALNCADDMKNTALELSACMFDYAARLLERPPVS